MPSCMVMLFGVAVMTAVLPSEYCSTTVVLPTDELTAISGAALAVAIDITAPANSADTAVNVAVFCMIPDER